VVKGGFPQLLISPINFEALYEQKQAAHKPQPPVQ
jgi:preprotein translocase subunit SecB